MLLLLTLACTTDPEPAPEEAIEAPKDSKVEGQLAEICRVDAMGLGRAPDPGELVELDLAATGIPEGVSVRVTSAWTEIEGERVYPEDLLQTLKDLAKGLEEAHDKAQEEAEEKVDFPRPVANLFVSREVLPEDLSPVLQELSKRFDARFVGRTTEKSPRPADWSTYETVLTDMERGDGPAAIARALQSATAKCPDVAAVLDEASLRRDCSHLQTALPAALDACGGKVDPNVVLSLLHVSLLPPAETPLLAGWVVPLDCEGGARVELRGAWDTGYRAVLDRKDKPTCF